MRNNALLVLTIMIAAAACEEGTRPGRDGGAPGNDIASGDAHGAPGADASGSADVKAAEAAASDLAQAVQCDRYASPAGGGDGSSASSPFQIADFWSVAAPGMRLCLLDGVYTGDRSNIDPPDGVNGTSSAPITIAALHDGKVRIDGQNARQPVHLQNNSWLVIEGINANNSSGDVVEIADGATYNVIRRVVAWDARDENTDVFGVHEHGDHNLLEDVAGFGVARKIFQESYGGDYTTCRRCWGRWEGSTNVGPKMTMTVAYDNQHMLAENFIGTWNEGSMPASYVLQNNGAVWTGSGAGTYTGVQAAQGILTDDGQSMTAAVRIFGSIAYLQATDAYSYGGLCTITRNMDDVLIAHSVAYAEPGSHSGTHTFLIDNSATNIVVQHLTSIGGAGNTLSGAAATDVVSGATTAAVPSIYDGSSGANVCKRYVDGVLTAEPLWPWPMNQRILDATGPNEAGAAKHQHYIYQGSPPSLSLVTAPHKQVDVTATIEKLFGPIPAACRAGP